MGPRLMGAEYVCEAARETEALRLQWGRASWARNTFGLVIR